MTDRQPSQSTRRAKRVFLMNLTLCALLVAILIVHHLNRSDQIDPTEAEATRAELEPQSALKIANMMGQAHGLSEDPRAYYRLSNNKLFRPAKQATTQIEQMPNMIIDADHDTLTSAYIDGYHARFEEYYSDRDGHDAGYLFGLKQDPTTARLYTSRLIDEELEHYKSKALKKYNLDEIQWLIFKKSFDEAYQSGFIKTQAGITVPAWQEIEFLED
jgi:hypothetical protein